MILEIKENYAIAMKQGGEIVKIRKKDGMQVGSIIYILPEDLYREKSNSSVLQFRPRYHGASKAQRGRLLRQVAGVAAILVLVITLALYGAVLSVYAVASFDGEQSLQLELDKNNRIVGGSSPSDQITEDDIRQLKGKNLTDVAGPLSSLLGKGPVLVGYASYKNDADEDARMEQLLRELLSEHIVLCLSGTGEDIDQAQTAQKSLGSLLAEELLGSYDREKLDDLLEAYEEIREELSEGDEDVDIEDLLEEIAEDPDYDEEDVLEILEDRVEDLRREQEDDDEDPDDDEPEEPDASEESDDGSDDDSDEDEGSDSASDDEEEDDSDDPSDDEEDDPTEDQDSD